MARDLYDRLKQLKAQRDGQKRLPPAHAGPVDVTGLDEWLEVTPLVRTRLTTREAPAALVGADYSRLLNRPLRPEELCFLDTETTGLSGGAGTTVFLIGTGRITGTQFTVRQTLLLDFPGEPEFLEHVRAELFDGAVWVSYNGKAFDSRLLATRFLMNGMPVELPPQLDLLFWARRLWRRLIGPCSLEDVEQRVLGIDRGPDIPGFDIPERYFQFLRSGDGSELAEVFSHHLRDIDSLMRLYLHLEAILEQSARDAVSPVEKIDRDSLPEFDRLALGKYLLVRNRGGERLLREVVDSPEEREPAEVRNAAGLLLAAVYRRRGDFGRAAELWERMWSRGSVSAGIELAKHHEHRTGDLDAAERLVARAAELVESLRDREALEHRLRRIRRKRSSSGPRRRREGSSLRQPPR